MDNINKNKNLYTKFNNKEHEEFFVRFFTEMSETLFKGLANPQTLIDRANTSIKKEDGKRVIHMEEQFFEDLKEIGKYGEFISFLEHFIGDGENPPAPPGSTAAPMPVRSNTNNIKVKEEEDLLSEKIIKEFMEKIREPIVEIPKSPKPKNKPNYNNSPKNMK